MTINELIDELELLREEHGNLNVMIKSEPIRGILIMKATPEERAYVSIEA